MLLIPFILLAPYQWGSSLTFTCQNVLQYDGYTTQSCVNDEQKKHQRLPSANSNYSMINLQSPDNIICKITFFEYMIGIASRISDISENTIYLHLFANNNRIPSHVVRKGTCSAALPLSFNHTSTSVPLIYTSFPLPKRFRSVLEVTHFKCTSNS